MSDKRILVVEDEPLIADDLILTLQEQGYLTHPPVDNYNDAIKYLTTGTDLALVDIMIEGDKDGVAIGQYIKEYVKIPYLYISSLSDQHTLERIRTTEASGYLVKPIDEKELLLNVELSLYKSKTRIEQNRSFPDNFFIKSRGKSVRVETNQILFIKAVDNYSTLHLMGQSHVLSYNLKTVHESLDPAIFMRVHKSYVININAISHLEPGYIDLQGSTIPIGRAYKEQFLSQFNFL